MHINQSHKGLQKYRNHRKYKTKVAIIRNKIKETHPDISAADLEDKVQKALGK